MLSGEELAPVDVGKFPNVRTGESFKHHLRWLYDFPVCLQELFKDGSKLHDACQLKTPSNLQLVLRLASNASQKEVADELTGESSRGNVEVVRLLLRARADMELTDSKQRTALMSASEKGHMEVVRLLVEARANMDRTANNKTALMTASAKGHFHIAQLLAESC